MAQLLLLTRGQRFAVTAYAGDDGRCEVIEFLEDRRTLEAADEEAFQDLFKRHADQGPIRNEHKSRALGDGLFEYKANRGGRIAWFYLDGALVVCACGVVKKKQKADPGFIRRAQAIREQCLREKSHGQLHRDF